MVGEFPSHLLAVTLTGLVGHQAMDVGSRKTLKYCMAGGKVQLDSGQHFAVRCLPTCMC